MENLTIRYCTIDEIEHAPNIGAIVAEYVEESHNPELPSPDVQWEHYKALEASDLLVPIAAFADDELVGFVTMLASKMPHHGKTLAITESFFVAKAHRKGGAGLKLLRAAEHHAKGIGSPCLLVSAPHGGALEAAMPKLGYRHANTMFVRSLRDE